jgi:hypothetical protein
VAVRFDSINQEYRLKPGPRSSINATAAATILQAER